MNYSTNYDFTQWFEKRNLRQLGYQSEKMQTVISSIATQELPTVFAACPSAGKTLMSICMIDTILKDNPDFRVLVLAHGTTVLRSQYAEEVASAKPDFTFCEVENKADMINCEAQVVIAIPQSINKIKNFPKFDMVVVDEAHQFYFAEMVQGIIRQSKAKYQLMLTGTPSIFILNEFPLITVTVNDILDYGMVEDLTVVVASSNYRANREDFNQDGELRGDFFNNQEEETNNTLDDFLTVLESKLKSVLKEFTKLEAGVAAITGWQLALKQLDKTMIVARSQHQARQIRNYFFRKGVNVALSTSDTDMNSTEIQRFKDDNECRVLIVVGRGILGFSFPRMINVVDMSGTQNLDRIFQLMCRVIRIHPEGRKKFFFKIAPKDLEHNYEYIMTATMCLCDETYYTKYNGENFLDLEIPVIRTPRPPREPGGEDEPREPRERTNRDAIRPVEFLGLPEGIRFFKDLLHKDNGAAMVNHSFAKIREVKYLLGEYEQAPNGWWDDKKNVYDVVNSVNSFDEFAKQNHGAYEGAKRNGWLDDIKSKFNVVSKNSLTRERILEIMSNYTDKTTFMKNESGCVSAITRNGWDDLYDNLSTKIKPNGYWENHYDEVKEIALTYSVKSHWEKGHSGSFKVAKKMGWLDELCSHMKQVKKPNGYWDVKDNCIEEAKKYSNLTEFNKKANKAYETARKNGWLEECKKYFNK